MASQTWVKRGVFSGVLLGVPRREAAQVCCFAPLEVGPSAQPGRSNQVKVLRERKGTFLCKTRLYPGKTPSPNRSLVPRDDHHQSGCSAAGGGS